MAEMKVYEEHFNDFSNYSVTPRPGLVIVGTLWEDNSVSEDATNTVFIARTENGPRQTTTGLTLRLHDDYDADQMRAMVEHLAEMIR